MTLSEFITNLINNIAVEEKFIDYKLETDAGSQHGDNYFGVTFAVKLIGDKEIDGEVKTITKHLFCKSLPASPLRRQIDQLILAFEREVEIYSKVLPPFIQIQDEKGLTNAERFNSFPKVYAALCDKVNDNHILIMDDLRQQNFKMFPKEQRTNIEHATLVMTELAKYHAISFALKDQRPAQFEEIKRKDVYLEMIKTGGSPAVWESLDRASRVLKKETHRKVFDGLKENYIELLEKFTDESFIGDSGVITHGDLWNNNILFQYKQNNDYESPLATVFLDWQLSRYGSPVLDIFYFIFTASDKSFRDSHYLKLLTVYHSTLSANIRRMGSDPDKLYPFEELESDLKKYGQYALIFAIFMTQFCIVEQKNVMDLDEYSEKILKGEKCNLLHDLDNNEAFLNLIDDIVEDIFSYGYVDY